MKELEEYNGEVEIWVTPEESDGRLQISNLGRVRIKTYMTPNGYLIPEHYLKPHCNKNSKNAYVEVNDKKFFIRRMIAKEFLPNPNNYPHVLLKDGNPLNLRVDNLYWGKYELKPNGGYHGTPKSDFDKVWEHRFDHQKRKGGRPKKKGIK